MSLSARCCNIVIQEVQQDLSESNEGSDTSIESVMRKKQEDTSAA